jgi:PAS domain S-box-containing protein
LRLVNGVAAEKLTGVGIRVPHGTMNYENGTTTIDGMKPGQKLDANESVANESAATTVASGKFGSGSIIDDPGTPSADSSEGSLTPPKPAATIIGIDPKNVRGSAHFVRLGASIMIFFESLYLLADRNSLDGFRTIVFPLHLFIFLTLVGYAIVARSRVGTLRRQAVVLGACLVIFAATGGLAIATGNDEFLVLTLMIVLVGSSALVAWGTRWQAMLSLSSLGTMAAWSLWAPVADPQSAIHWAAVCAAAAYAQLTAWVGERYRDELDGRFKELYANHRRLVGEIAGRERAVAANEVSNRRLRDSETKLRKIFATSVDAITISRLSDGRYLDLNEGFSRWSGYSREEVVGQTAGSFGIWATRKQLRQFIDQIETTGVVTNFECEVRSKNGNMMPCLTSATVVELGGEPCVVAIARDITAFNQTQRDLIAAREVMRAQIESLERTEGLLRAEIIERVAAVAVSEIAHRQLTESEAKLRKIFETSGDLISINRVSDGRYQEANDAYGALGYTRAEMLTRSAESLGIWANREQLRECMKMLASGRTVANMEIDLRAKNGRVAPFLVSAKVIELSGEACVVAIARDITAIKQTQHELIAAREQMAQQLRALQESEKRLRAEVAERELAQDRANQSARVLLRIFNTTQVGISINRVADGRFLQINAAYAEILGFTCEELLRLTVRETGLIANRAHFRQFVADLERLGSIPEIEMDLRSRDGTLHPLQVSAVKLEVDGAPVMRRSWSISRGGNGSSTS